MIDGLFILHVLIIIALIIVIILEVKTISNRKSTCNCSYVLKTGQQKKTYFELQLCQQHLRYRNISVTFDYFPLNMARLTLKDYATMTYNIKRKRRDQSFTILIDITEWLIIWMLNPKNITLLELTIDNKIINNFISLKCLENCSIYDKKLQRIVKI